MSQKLNRYDIERALALPANHPRHRAVLRPVYSRATVYLAGPVSKSPVGDDWRTRLGDVFSQLPVTIFDPANIPWDPARLDDSKYVDAVKELEWGTRNREQADMVIFYFNAGSEASDNLLELGLSLGSMTWTSFCLLVYVSQGYSKRDTIENICKHFNLPVFRREANLFSEVKRTLDLLMETGSSTQQRQQKQKNKRYIKCVLSMIGLLVYVTVIYLAELGLLKES